MQVTMSALLVYATVGFMGGGANWLRKWSEGSTYDTFGEYLKSNVKYTVRSTIGVLSLVAGAALTGEPSMYGAVTLFLSCLAADAALNRSSEYVPNAIPIKVPIGDGVSREQAKQVLRQISEKVKYEDIQKILDDDAAL